MAVTFVKPELNQVIKRKSDGAMFRVIADCDEYSLIYRLPTLDDLLNLINCDFDDYDELCSRYAQWLKDDSTVTPLLFSENLPPQRDLSSELGLLKALHEMSQSPWNELGEWQLSRIYVKRPYVKSDDDYDDDDYYGRYNRYNRYNRYDHYYDYDDDDDDDDEVDPAIAQALEWDEVDFVRDPFAPLLHTHQNRWERVKSRDLYALLAPLDFARVWKFVEGSGSSFFNNMGVRLGMPAHLVQHLLHVWCIFGGCKEGLIYAQELLSAQSALTASQDDELGAWSYRLWLSWSYQLAMQLDVRKEQKVKPEFWDESVAEYGSAIMSAFGGPKYSLLYAVKHSTLFQPQLKHFEAICHSLNSFDGKNVKRAELETYGIDPNFLGWVLPLPCKAGTTLPAELKAKLQAELDFYCMGLALEQAVLAYKKGEVPVGAVVLSSFDEGLRLLAAKGNSVISEHDPSAHAEILALRAAGKEMDNYRLGGTTLYVTLEPCCMCAMAAIHARVDRIVYGAVDPRTGACGSVFDLVNDPHHNHHVEVVGGVRAQECSQLLKRFFAERREQSREQGDAD